MLDSIVVSAQGSGRSLSLSLITIGPHAPSMNDLKQQVLRATDATVCAEFFSWAKAENQNGVVLIVVEGLEGSGKSHIASEASRFSLIAIDLDEFLPPREDRRLSWCEHVVSGGGLSAVDLAIQEGKRVIVFGVAAWPALMPAIKKLSPDHVRRAYIKRIQSYPGCDFWDDRKWLPETIRRRNTEYARSFLEYHAYEEPWLYADLIVERVDNDPS